ncbi:hypothetical protein B0H19DRAFT_1062508 [Mycena capillaripes]|nr:hypothetical protein B0H19DRAFT_1062508 [Mycena capillaripes]
MVPPLSLSTIFLISFCAWGCARAALVNRTIEDFDPSMQYNCTVGRCDANLNTCQDGALLNNRTFTFTKFSGTAVYAFMNCKLCQFEVDKTGLHTESSSDATVFSLTYFNNTLANDTHTLVVTSASEMVMNSVVYTFDDSVPTTQGASGKTASRASGASRKPASSTTASDTTSTSASATLASGPDKGGHTQKPPKAQADVRVIVGGVLGGLVIIVSAAAIIFFKRRAGRRKKSGRIFLGDPHAATHPSPQADVEADPSGTVQHDNSVVRLEAQMGELQAELRAALGTQPRRVPSDGTRLAVMKREQMQAVRDHAPAVLPGDLLLHTDSGVRLTPARQLEELPPQYIEV